MRLLEEHMKIRKHADCLRAGVEAFEGDIDGALQRLESNGRWGVDPWPDLHSLVADKVEVARKMSANCKTGSGPMLAARLVVGGAIADRLGVPSP